MVCSYTLALVHLLLHQNIIDSQLLTKNQLASICAKSERFVGVESGGMDQAISFLAEKDFAMKIDFLPNLTATKVQLPSCAKFVLCNSMVEHALQSEEAGNGYNIRVVECRLASALLAHYLDLPEKNTIRILSQIETAYQDKDPIDRLDKCLEAVKTYLHENYYSINELKNILGEDICSRYNLERVNNIESLNFHLFKRAFHVYSETKRVLLFQKYCINETIESEEDLKIIGDLMNSSHESCKEYFECSCDELDNIVAKCISFGATAARLTGAGWGGWCIALVHNDVLSEFVQRIGEFYNSHEEFFETMAASGAKIQYSQ